MARHMDNNWHGTASCKGIADNWDDNSTVYRHRRRVLCGCPFCPPHDGENRRRRVKSDKGKNKRR